MSLSKQLKYNRKSASKHGWEPQWFEAFDFDEYLVDRIKNFQLDQNLTPDGLVGPLTYRRIVTYLESEQEHQRDNLERTPLNHVIYNGKHFPIEWDMVKLWNEEGGLKAKKYKKWKGDNPRKIQMFVCHWDAALSSRSTQKILNKRGLSVTFLISADGCIYQTCDLNHITYHCKRMNAVSTGVEMNNAYSLKYNRWYERHGYGSRPICKDSIVRGKKLKPHLGFYNVQLRALQALFKALAHPEIGLQLQTPNTTHVVPEVQARAYHGIIHHYHATARKIDCGGLDLQKLIDEL